MNQSTKQRIVGTVVLIALALILLPLIFDGQGSYQQPISSRIPEPPFFAVLPESVQNRPVIVADTDEILIEEDTPSPVSNVDGVADGGVAVTDSVPDYSRETPQLDERGIPEGWSVRLGSFSNAENANNLLNQLQASGYKAYTRTVNGDQGDLIRVFVGPWVDRELVDENQQQLQQQFQLAGIVVKFEVEEL
ncbi:MAG: SPOR domain-containing protein [Gammaproteobacteria bacterium]|nr:SPOR domain-containing protein [Gammaproteobacteria bacterium]